MVEIAFFPVNDMKTEATVAVNASVSEEFSSLLASFMPQANPEASIVRQAPVADAAAIAGVDNRQPEPSGELKTDEDNETAEYAGPQAQFFAVKRVAVNAKFSKSLVDGSADIAAFEVKNSEPISKDAVLKTPDAPRTADQKLIQACEKEGTAAVSDNFSPAVQTVQVEEAGKSVEQVFSTALIKAQVPTQTLDPVSEDRPSEALTAEGAFELTRPSLSREESTKPEKIRAKAHVATEHLKAQATDEKMIDGKVAEPEDKFVVASSDAQVFSSTEVFTSKAFEPSIVVKETLHEVDRAVDSEVTEVPALFSRGFEGHELDRETAGDGSGQPLGQDQPILKAEHLVSGAAFGKHMETAVEKPLAPAAPGGASAPVAAEVRDRVEAGIKLSAGTNGGEVRMKLNPESLGEVRIKLDVSSGAVRAEIVVERHEVKAMIEADSAFLKDALGSHGLTLDKCVVEVAKPFDAKARLESLWQDSASEERASSGHKGREDKDNNGWHGRFNQERRREEDRGVDFFI